MDTQYALCKQADLEVRSKGQEMLLHDSYANPWHISACLV